MGWCKRCLHWLFMQEPHNTAHQNRESYTTGIKWIPFLSYSFGSNLSLSVLLKKFFNVFTNTSEMEPCKPKLLVVRGVNILLVSFTDISSPAVRTTRVARTEKTRWANRWARKKVFLFPDMILGLQHAVAAEPALNVMDTAILKGFWYPSNIALLPFGTLLAIIVFSSNNWRLTRLLSGLQCMYKRDWTYLPVWKRVCGDRSGSGPWAVLIDDSASTSCSTSLWHAFKRAVPTKRPIQPQLPLLFPLKSQGNLTPESWVMSPRKPLLLSALLSLPGA